MANKQHKEKEIPDADLDAELKSQDSGKPEEDRITISRQEYLELKAKETEVNEKMLRMQAEVENIKKRLERDRLEFIKFSNEQILSELVPFIDDFQRAFAAADKSRDFDVLHKGVEMILNHLLELLRSKGVSQIEAEGKPFDPAFHEAMLQVENDDYPDGTVVEELQKGYLLNGRVLRTAKVKVSKTKENNEND